MKKSEKIVILSLTLSILYYFYTYVDVFMNFEAHKEIWMENVSRNLKIALLHTILSVACLVGFLRREKMAEVICKKNNKYSFEYIKLLYGIGGGGFFLLQIVYLVYVAAILYGN